MFLIAEGENADDGFVSWQMEHFSRSMFWHSKHVAGRSRLLCHCDLENESSCLLIFHGVHTPGVHTPGMHTPSVHTPGVQAPGVHTPGVHTPGTHTPGMHTPGVHTPGMHTPRHAHTGHAHTGHAHNGRAHTGHAHTGRAHTRQSIQKLKRVAKQPCNLLTTNIQHD